MPHLDNVVIWGLCDAASAAVFYAHQDSRVKGLILLNPWVRTETGMAKTYVKQYYFSRLTNLALWKKIITGKFNFKASILSLIKIISTILGGKDTTQAKSNEITTLFNQNISLPLKSNSVLDSFSAVSVKNHFSHQSFK